MADVEVLKLCSRHVADTTNVGRVRKPVTHQQHVVQHHPSQ